MSLLLALDLGTESIRAGAFDEHGVLVASAQADYPTRFPRPGWAEQSPEDWWSATLTTLGEISSQIGDRPISGVGLATTASTVAVLDGQGRSLRPALLWMDARAHAEAGRTTRVTHPVMRYSGGGDAAEWLVPKAMWLAVNEPRVYAAADRIVEAVDYLTYRLTGRWVASRMNAVCKWNYSERDGGFPHDLYAELGVPDLAAKLPGEVAAVGAPVGTVLPEVMRQAGLRGAPTVAAGGIDAHLSMLSTGALACGDVSVVAGTSVAHVTQIDEPVFTPAIWGPYPDALLSGRWLIEGGQISGGVLLRWAAETLLGRSRDQGPQLIAEASAVAPGSNGLLVLDYLMGNRTPYRDAKLRGAVLGLTLDSKPAEIYRAAVESVAYGTRNVLQSFSEAGIPVKRICISGGIRHNPLWKQVTADVLGQPIELVTSQNLTLLSGAACAASAAGLFPDLVSAAGAFGAECVTIEPDPALSSLYTEGFELYREATAAVTGVSHSLVDRAVRP
ncbi:FGGY-family carbohydrate kinase [Kineosporia succinea]|uniref:Ribulokinase n=1 Tax=Kineosporia succinea TaxID=84632 RepID=A0ABT9PER9_9ACTN|nr:FGGY-family carbohydrate kinase [Kineosporia succinea]MDP9830480.1 ribulokinase [Kineosporia succinea]